MTLINQSGTIKWGDDMAKILIIDDEKAINDLISFNLTLVGHKCLQLYTSKDIPQFLKMERPDLILLDVMLPEKNGFELIEDIKKFNIPVIFLTARNSVSDRVTGLEIGAEDYVVKPFEAVELNARINVVLRRNKSDIKEFRLDDVVVNFTEHKVFVDGIEIELKKQEYELLELLIQNKNIALSRDAIIDKAWELDYFGETRTVDVHIQKLRKKLNWQNRIKTVYKFGYRLEV